MLLREALDGLERRWRERGMPVDELLVPGLSAEVIRQVVRQVGDPRHDVLAWYEWRNGTAPGSSLCAAPSERKLTSLDEAIELRQMIFEIEHVVAPDLFPDPALRFPPTCLPVAWTQDAGESTIAVDLVTGEVYRRDNVITSSEFPQTTLLIADDLESLVRIWCAELDRGKYIWNPELGVWDYDAADQPADLYERNIIH